MCFLTSSSSLNLPFLRLRAVRFSSSTSGAAEPAGALPLLPGTLVPLPGLLAGGGEPAPVLPSLLPLLLAGPEAAPGTSKP